MTYYYVIYLGNKAVATGLTKMETWVNLSNSQNFSDPNDEAEIFSVSRHDYNEAINDMHLFSA